MLLFHIARLSEWPSKFSPRVRKDVFKNVHDLGLFSEVVFGALDRTREADLGKRLEEHQRVGADHEKRFAALAEEQRLLRTRAEESRRGLEPHATYVSRCTLL
jgi:hypothetical protein